MVQFLLSRPACLLSNKLLIVNSPYPSLEVQLVWFKAMAVKSNMFTEQSAVNT